MDKKTLGLAATSLLGAATLLTASPAHADELICECPIVIGPGPVTADPFLKISESFDNLTLKIIERHGAESTPLLSISDAFNKLTLKFSDAPT
jgi:hypothetical protein